MSNEIEEVQVTPEALAHKYEQRLQSISANIAVLRQAQQLVGDKVTPELNVYENVAATLQEVVVDLRAL